MDRTQGVLLAIALICVTAIISTAIWTRHLDKVCYLENSYEQVSEVGISSWVWQKADGDVWSRGNNLVYDLPEYPESP